jgi:hypothetical protein
MLGPTLTDLIGDYLLLWILLSPIVEQLVVAVVVLMLVAVGVQAYQPERVGRYDTYYPAVSALMTSYMTDIR